MKSMGERPNTVIPVDSAVNLMMTEPKGKS